MKRDFVMDEKTRNVLRWGLLDSQAQREELFRCMGMIQRFDEIIASGPQTESLSRELVRIVLEETGFEKCSIFLWNDDQKKLMLSAAMRLEDLLNVEGEAGESSTMEWNAHYHMIEQVHASKTPVFLENMEEMTSEKMNDNPLKPVFLASMPIGDLGVLNLRTHEPAPFPFQVRRSWAILCKIMEYLFKNSLWRSGAPMPAEGGVQREMIEGAKRSSGRNGSGRESLDPFMGDALDFTPQGICLLNASGHLMGFNRSMKELQGEGTEAMIGRSPAVLFLDPENFEKLFAEALAQGRAELQEVSLVNHKREAYSADVRLISLPMDKERATGFLLLIDDVTQKKALREKILQTEKLAAVGTMAGGVAHDFNNLLMAILGHIQLLVPQVQDADIVRRLKNMEKAVFDGSHLIRRLQKFTRRDKGVELAMVPADADDAIRDVLELTRPRWKNGMEKLGRSIEFQLDLQPGCRARMHGSDLREVLTNLIFNAIEAMPEGGVIRIRNHAHEDRVHIEIADSGIGMSSEVAGKIFDPFFTTKGFGNSGLGLSVCWSLIVQHGGDIRVNSAPGRGATFHISLPRAEAVDKDAQSSAEERSSPSRTILVVDDDEEILSILGDMIRMKGHRVLVASEGAKALELIEKEHCDLVLTDLGMPIISGWEIARRAKEKDPRIPVVLVTGWGAQYEEDDLSHRGVDVVLSKPLSWDKLLETLHRLLEKTH